MHFRRLVNRSFSFLSPSNNGATIRNWIIPEDVVEESYLVYSVYEYYILVSKYSLYANLNSKLIFCNVISRNTNMFIVCVKELKLHIFFLFVLVYNSSLSQWRNGYSPTCKPQIRSESSAQLLQGRKKRHLSETALGRLKWG